MFLEEHIPPKSKMILIGHSIGAYIILHLLKNCHRAEDVTKCILLFPTIERMAISPSGRYVTPMVTYFKWCVIATVTVFSFLPEFVKKGLVQWWLSNRKNLMLNSVDSVLKLLTPQPVNGCLTMAQDEMKEVVDLDEEVSYIRIIISFSHKVLKSVRLWTGGKMRTGDKSRLQTRGKMQTAETVDFLTESCYHFIGRRVGLMVSALDSGASGLGSSPGRGKCIVFLGKTLYSHSVSLHPGV